MKCPYCGKIPQVNAVPLTEMYSVSCSAQFDHWFSVYATTADEAVAKWRKAFETQPSRWDRLKLLLKP